MNGKLDVKKTTQKELEYYQNQIANSNQHLNRDWGLLKDKTKNWTRSEILEIVSNIEKEAEYLGEVKIKLQTTQSFLDQLNKTGNNSQICFQCQQNFSLIYNLSKKTFSLKNNWGYWTENEIDQDKFVCNNCLLKLYKNKEKYLKSVVNSKKRQMFTSYIYSKTIS